LAAIGREKGLVDDRILEPIWYDLDRVSQDVTWVLDDIQKKIRDPKLPEEVEQ
jgi:hypothetical protein